MPSLRAALPLAGPACTGGDRLTLERLLRRQVGVLEVLVNAVTEMAYVEFDPAVTGEGVLLGVLERAGYASAGSDPTGRDRRAVGRSRSA